MEDRKRNLLGRYEYVGDGAGRANRPRIKAHSRLDPASYGAQRRRAARPCGCALEMRHGWGLSLQLDFRFPLWGRWVGGVTESAPPTRRPGGKADHPDAGAG